jgi:hypothetical protein
MYLGTYNIKKVDWSEDHTGERLVLKGIGKIRGAQTDGKWVPCTFALVLYDNMNFDHELELSEVIYDLIAVDIFDGYYGSYNGYGTAHWVSHTSITFSP